MSDAFIAVLLQNTKAKYLLFSARMRIRKRLAQYIIDLKKEAIEK